MKSRRELNKDQSAQSRPCPALLLAYLVPAESVAFRQPHRLALFTTHRIQAHVINRTSDLKQPSSTGIYSQTDSLISNDRLQRRESNSPTAPGILCKYSADTSGKTCSEDSAAVSFCRLDHPPPLFWHLEYDRVIGQPLSMRRNQHSISKSILGTIL